MCMICAGEIHISTIIVSRKSYDITGPLDKVGLYSAQYNWDSYIYNSLERLRNGYNVKMIVLFHIIFIISWDKDRHKYCGST